MAMKKDITGQRFGQLMALRPTEQRRGGKVVWECQCDCGKIVFLLIDALTSGKTKSCGCLKFKVKDITGQRFGQLTALRPTDQRINKKILWECRCDCGKIVLLSQNTMATGATKSCGCNRVKWRIIDLTGKKFGRLTVLRMTGEKRTNKLLWECRCDCGNITVVTGDCLRNGGTQSCGCLLNERRKKGRLLYKKKYCVSGTNILSLCPKPGIANNSGAAGVSFHTQTQKWRADIKFKGKCYTLGEYKDKNEAIAARKKAEEELHANFLAQHGQGKLEPDTPEFSDEVIEETLTRKVYVKRADHSARHQGIRLNIKKSSKYVGVSLKKDSRWSASISKDRKTIYLGSFSTEELAAEAYDDKAKELYGEHARLNFPSV